MDDFIKIALTGTAKAGAALATNVDHPADVLIEENAGAIEDRFLLRAGVRAVYQQAGLVADVSHAGVTAAPPDSKRRGSARLAGLLENAFAAESKELLAEFLRQMAAGEVLLPHQLLPVALNATDSDVRELLLPVLGERGRWLSEFHPDWNWARIGTATLGEKDLDALAQWNEGTIGERCQVLTTMRQIDADEARRWLEPVLPKEKAEHRAPLLALLETGLSSADQAFLETFLDDRSVQVKAVAGQLLALLPQSELARRMRDRADAMLSGETKGMLRKRLKLVCEPPETVDESWARDGIPSKPPAGVGKRTYWAELVISAIPPSHWSRKFETAAESLIEATEDDSFEKAVIAGWTTAAVRFASTDADTKAWVVPLWNCWAAKAGRLQGKGREEAFEHLAALLPVMEPSTAESSVLALIKGKGDHVEALSLLNSISRPWSAGFSHEYLALVRAVLRSSTDNRSYQWGNSLSTAAKAIPCEAFSAALTPWQFVEDKTGGRTQWNEREAERFCETIRMRQSFYEELS